MTEGASFISPPPPARRLAILAQAGFLLVGVVNTMLGPLLPMLSSKWRLDDAQAGRLFTAQFAGALLGAAASGPLIKRFGLLPLLATGYGGMAAAVACLGVSPWAVGMVSVFTYGLGLGLTIPATNLLISEMYPERRAAALNILNFMWGLGAVLSPPLISWLAQGGRLDRPLLGLAGLLAGISLPIMRCPPFDFSPGHIQASPSGSSTIRAWLSPYALLTGGLIFIYTGTETATGGWVASFARRLDTSPSARWAIVQSLFWAGLLIGRAAAPAALRLVAGETLVMGGLLATIAGLGMILGSGGIMGASVGAGLAGFGMAPVFPTTFAIFTQRLGALAPQLAGFIFVLASLGGALIPWAVGLVSDRSGALRTGLAIPFLGGVVMALLQLIIILRPGRTRVNSDGGRSR